ncbi:hypothetical protein [Methanosarcina barkeri]|nr:hypothetical protein [Methanosarcina barkeri]
MKVKYENTGTTKIRHGTFTPSEICAKISKLHSFKFDELRK